MKNKIIWSYCSKCRQDTKHLILYSKSIKVNDEEIELGKNTYQVVECNGCESITFRKEYLNYLLSGLDEKHLENVDNPEIKIYPSPLQNHNPLEWTYFLPKKIKDIYEQTILAFKGESKLLAGVGFRAIIEAICIEEKIKGHNLEQKINNLVKNRLITEKEAERLHPVRFLGNDSIHEIEIPSDNKLFLVLNIIEHLLSTLYIIDNNARNILDTLIKDYSEFEYLVFTSSRKFKVGENKSLREILGKQVRRIYADIADLEKELIRKIVSAESSFLSILPSNKHSGETIYTILEYEGSEYLPF